MRGYAGRSFLLMEYTFDNRCRVLRYAPCWEKLLLKMPFDSFNEERVISWSKHKQVFC
ncbi:hypothetical protein TDB9533_01018 [Thalassocella blandensis]|nr:hypothetical protein TDB9533_01018 [Thalassocella blandensis]